MLSSYSKAVRDRALEEALPHALFHIASLPAGTPAEKLVEEIACGEYGELSKEFGQASRQMRSGVSALTALDGIGGRSNSSFVRRCMRLLAASYETGADLSTAFQELAEDAFDQLALSREQAAQAALSKYTLLAASGLVVPLILGLLLNLVSSLDSAFSSEALIEFSGKSIAQREAVREAVALGSHAYLLAFSLLAGAFISFGEGKRFKAFKYFLVLAPLSQIVFVLARSHALQ